MLGSCEHVGQRRRAADFLLIRFGKTYLERSMSNPKEGSVAPKERINIRYVPATLGQQAEVELPLRLVVLGDFTGKEELTPVEERKAISVDKNSFKDVIAEAGLERNLTVKNRLSDDAEGDLRVSLQFKSLEDFEPDAIVQNVPELKKLVELREALVALKGPLGNMPAFRKRLQQLLSDEASRDALLRELEGVGADKSGPAVSDEGSVGRKTARK
jgi:type VI secretion system protein ImpB